MEKRKSWDQALRHRLTPRDRYRASRAMAIALLTVGLVVGLVPGVAQAHHFEKPGPQGVQINVEPDEELQPVQAVTVSGKGATPNATVTIYQCVNGTYGLMVVPRSCVLIGLAAVSAGGVFTAQVEVSAVSPAPDPFTLGLPQDPETDRACASIGTAQCEIAVRDPFTSTAFPYHNTANAMSARHNICFSSPAGTVSNACYTDLSGSTTTTTTTVPPPAPEWEPAPPMNVGRQGLATAVGVDGLIYAMGGKGTDGVPLTSAETLDPCGQRTWSPITAMPIARTEFAAATGPDGLIYVIGGRNAEGTAVGTVEAYDPVAKTWASVASLAMPRTHLAAATGPDGLIYAIGGKVGSGSVTVGVDDVPVGVDDRGLLTEGADVSTVEAYDTTTNEWQSVAPLSAPRSNHEATVGPDGRIYAIGGRVDRSTDGYFPEIEAYGPGPGGTPAIWTPVAYAPTPVWYPEILPREMAVTTGPDGLIYGVGGRAVLSVLRISRTFDIQAQTWTESPEPMTSPRMAHVAATGKDGRVYAIGGIDHASALDPAVPMPSVEALQVGPNNCPNSPPPADFDGNATTDYSVFRPSTGTWFVKDGLTLNYGTEGDIPVPGDYDGDRKADVAVFRPSNGVWFVRNSSGGDTAVGYGADGDIPVPADYDGDTKTDMAVFRPASGVWFIKYSAGGDAAVAWGTSGDVAVPGDYDGDDKADFAVFRNGTWFIRTASGAADITVNYGTSGDIPVVGDYDADNTADIAVFRPSNGFWFLRHSSDGAEEAFAFGTDGDIPVPGDYNGDRVDDPAVFRPSSGVWFVETGLSAPWGTATDIPLPLPHAVRSAYFGP